MNPRSRFPLDVARAASKQVVALLVSGKYREIEWLTKGRRLTAEHMQEAIGEYGRELTMPPEVQFDALDLVDIERSNPMQCSVRIDLWTKEEGRSDLTLELTLTMMSGEHKVGIEIDNLHVA